MDITKRGSRSRVERAWIGTIGWPQACWPSCWHIPPFLGFVNWRKHSPASWCHYGNKSLFWFFPKKTKTQCCSEGPSQGKDGKPFLMKSHFSIARLTVRKANLPCIRKIEDRTSGMSHHRAPLTGNPTWPHSHKLWVVYKDLLLKTGMRPIMGRNIPLKIHWPQHHVELGGWSQPPMPAELFGALPHWLRNARKVWLSATFLSWRFAWTLRQGHPVAGHLE